MRRLLLSAMLVLLLTACAAPVSDTNTPASAEPPDSASPPALTEASDGADGEVFQNRIAASPDVQGVVTGVIGNEVTLDLIEPITMGIVAGGEMPEGFDVTQIDPENLPEGMELPEGFDVTQVDPENMPEGFDREEMRERVREFTGGNGEMREGMELTEGMEMPQDGGGQRTGSRSFSMAGVEMEVTYTGESLSVTIPVGMLSSDPSKKQILMLWYGDDGEIINARITGTAKE